MPIRLRRAPLSLPLLALALAAGCAHGPRASGPPGVPAAFAGIGAVDLFVFTDLPNPVAEGMGVTSTELSRTLRAQLEEGGVRMGRQGDRPVIHPGQVTLNLSSLEVGPGQRAVWVRLQMQRVVSFPGRDLPLAATVWERSAKVLVRDGDAAALKREIATLAAEFVRLYRAAAPEMTVPAG